MNITNFPILLAGEFDSFSTTSPTVLNTPIEMIRDIASNIYLLEVRFSIYIIAIALVALGITTVLFANSPQERSTSKMWLVRIGLCAMLIFGIVGLVGKVDQAGKKVGTTTEQEQ